MNEEKKVQEPTKEVKGWKDVTINENMPLNVIINFMNVLNQRLCALEDVVTVQGPEGKMISLTDLYAIQAKEAEAELNKQQQPEKKKEA